MATTKTIALKLDIQGDGKLRELQTNFDQTRNSLKALNKAEREGRISANEASKARANLNVQLKANRNALNDQQNAILKNNNALKKNSGFVAGVRKGVGQWATSMIGVTAAIAGATKLIGNMISVVTDFSKSTSTLASVLGKTKDEISDLTAQAKELGSTTAFTASEVVELQTEFAKLGFPTEDILDMTASTLDAAAALGSELGEQAALTGAVIKGFGLDAEEAAKVNDVLAKSASKSALDFSKLSTALPIVGATAKTAGVSLERTTALLGTLSDRGIDASTAATSMRNIFLELSKQGISFEDAMTKINTATDKNAVAMDLFGKRSATAGIIIAEAGGSIDELEESLNNAEGAASDMADTMLDNLAGDITKAESAWEGFVLSLEDGEGVFSDITRGMTQSFTNFLGSLTSLNEGDFTGFTIMQNLGSDASKELDGLGLSLEQLIRAADNNEDVFKLLQQRFNSGEISIEKYRFGVEQLANGWERGSKAAEELTEDTQKLSEEQLNALKAEEEASAERDKRREQNIKKAADAAKREADAKKKEEERAEEDRKNRADTAQEEINKIRLQKLVEGFEDERERALINEGIKFDEKIAKIQGDSEEEKTLIIELETQKRDAIKQLQAQFDAEDKVKQEEERALELENNLIRAEEDFEQQNLIFEQQRQIALENENLTAAQREAINLEFDQKITDNKQKQEDIRRMQTQASLQVAVGAFDAIASLAEEGSAEQKALATVSAIINSYLAFTNALANTPAPAPFPQIAAASALLSGLAQVRKIQATQAAKGMYMEDGGMIKGASHAMGGVPFTIDGVGGFEAEGGEAIINKRSTAMFKPLLSQINEAGGGVAFARGGLVSKFQNGGALSPNNVGVTAGQQQAISSNTNLQELGDTIVSGVNDKEVINVATNTSTVAAEVINIEADATF